MKKKKNSNTNQSENYFSLYFSFPHQSYYVNFSFCTVVDISQPLKTLQTS